jgi:hypothetical protein
MPGFENIMDQANDALAEMVADGVITAEERARMVLGTHPRRKRDLLAPFVPGGRVQNLIIEDLEMCELPDAGWIDYERDGNKEYQPSTRCSSVRYSCLHFRWHSVKHAATLRRSA